MRKWFPVRILRFWRWIGSSTIKCTTALFANVAAILCFAQSSGAQPFDQVIVFGDSNVDSGYYKALSSPGGSSTYNSLWPTAVANGAGAPTTNPGLVKSQVLASILGLTANPANTTNGTNYATSGAKNVTVNKAQTGGFTAAIPTVTQISNYLSAKGGVANSQALYLIDSGDNDASYAAGETGAGPYPSNPQTYITQAAGQLASAIQSLFNAGARSIIVSGLFYNFPPSDTNLKSLKLLYTQTLWSDLTTLGVPFFQADIDPLLSDIVSNPVFYGFNSISSSNPACTKPAGPTTAWALICSKSPSAPSTYVSANAPQINLWADDEHLATEGQQLFGNFFYNFVAPTASPLVSAVLPASRSAQPGGTVTAFATMINTGTTTATDCSIAPLINVPATFLYQTTNPATNALTGTANTPVNITAGGSQSFVIALTPSAAFPPGSVTLSFSCNSAPFAPIVSGLNTLLLSASSTPTPDVIALVATIQNDGIVHVTNGSPATGVFAVATDNLGSGDTITVATNTGEATLPITITVCQTIPATGVCMQTAAPSVSTPISSGATPTFGVFVTATGTVPFSPANNRIFVTFTDSTNTVRGETSVAVETQ